MKSSREPTSGPGCPEWSASTSATAPREATSWPRARGKAIGGAAVTDDAMLAIAPAPARDRRPSRHRHGQEEGPASSPATVMRMLREQDEKAAAAAG